MRALVIGFCLFLFVVGFNAGKRSVDPPPPEIKEVTKVERVEVEKIVYKTKDFPDACYRALKQAEIMANRATPIHNSLAKVEAEIKRSRIDTLMQNGLAERLESIRALEAENSRHMTDLVKAEYIYQRALEECKEGLK